MSLYQNYMLRVQKLKEEKPLFKQIEIEINLGCNRRCSYCFLATLKREDIIKAHHRIMDWELYCQLLNQLKDIGFKGEINFHFYAEPLLNKKLANFIREAKKILSEVTTVIYTNGDYLTENKYKILEEAGLDSIYVTLHDNVIPEHLKPVLKYQNVTLDSRGSMIIYNRAGYLGKTSNPAIKNLPCVYSALAVIVTIDGNVLPCSCDFNESMIFGNIREQHLLEIWNAEKTRTFRKDLLDGYREKYALCKDCDNYYDNLDVQSNAELQRSYYPEKIIKLLVFFPSLGQGGCEEYAKDMTKHALALGWQVEVCFPQIIQTKDLLEFFKDLNLPIHSWNLDSHCSQTEWGTWHEQKAKANQLLDHVRPDSVLIALPAPDSALGFIMACGEQKIGGAVVFQLCTDVVSLSSQQLSGCKIAQEQGLQWVATSKFMRHYLANSFNIEASKITVIPNGRVLQENIIKYGKEYKNKKYISNILGLPDNIITILTLARLTEQKGHKDILAIAADILKQFPNVHFIWAGSGENEEDLKSMVYQKNLQHCIHMLGNRSDIDQLLNSADIFLLPSHWESTPLSVTEAMYYKCPVIASDAGGIPELIDHQVTGTLFPARNQQALYEALIAVLANPEKIMKMLPLAKEIAIARSQFMKDQVIKILFENRRRQQG